MPHFRKKFSDFLAGGLVIFLRTDTAKLGFFTWISLHPPKFGKCFKTPKISAKGLKHLLPHRANLSAPPSSIRASPSSVPCPTAAWPELWPEGLESGGEMP